MLADPIAPPLAQNADFLSPFQADATARGFTVEVVCDSDEYTLEGWIRPDTDLDGRFALYDSGDGEILRVNGWLFSTERAHPYQSQPA